MQINATLINLYHVCHRECWLHANEIRMEHTSDIVTEGRLIGQQSYERRSDQYSEMALSVPLPGLAGVNGTAKMDYYDRHTRTVHETKRGKAIESAHEAQVKYYLYLLRLSGVPDATGKIEYPDLRQTHRVVLPDEEMSTVESWIRAVHQLIHQTQCPPVIRSKICKNCSFHDLCYAGEI